MSTTPLGDDTVEEKKIAVHSKSRGDTIYVYIQEFNGTNYLHIREWYTENGEEKRSKKGVAVPLEKVEQLREAIDELMAELK
jgi:hypothetical protein